ncbi:MAG: exodeoxyribonuclease V subunit alpha [Marinospirillum sp.]|uniref:exodeoxyribonuclease V subunit alpha n=1 Tax=Marinospirillum sp. TaxID=2183934 RepID=UPI0019F9E33F|nr:exodeoxyribonuclease V subunit alpha [Marinospirillum sp.]MBE0507048.1 exodeoxyribonuclease V subunit alpha [Marinospirillum sp.]
MNALEKQIVQWVEIGALRPLDLALMRLIQEQCPEASDPVLLATALVSEANGRGHVCLDLKVLLEKPAQQLARDDRYQPADPGDKTDEPGQELARLLHNWTLDSWTQALLTSEAVSDQRDQPQPCAGTTPLVLAGTAAQPLLYLRRYWLYERQIRAYLDQQLQSPRTLPDKAINSLLDALFPEPPPTSVDYQKQACALAARSSFSIITGGPGTGKTTTVVRLLALLQGLQQQAGLPPLTIRLAAPTGKAAARLSESLAGSMQKINLPETLQACREHIPTEVTTLHRLLGSQAGTRHFRHHQGNPLPADLVIVDEASMVDVEMLARLMAALTPQTRLVLLGDKDQLASVEAGSVLGDLCRSAEASDYTTLLEHSYRFADYPGIGKLAKAVNSGQSSLKAIKGIFECYQRQDEGTVTRDHNLWLIKLKQSRPPAATDLEPLKKLLRQGYKAYLQVVKNDMPVPGADGEVSREALDAWAQKIFAKHKAFQLLTAVRRGSWGVEAMNQLATAALKDLLPGSSGLWYSGRPVLVTRNDYSLKLMNGDIGICLAWSGAQTETGRPLLRVAFPDGRGGIRWVLPSRLQDVETVFAMTVHKSQGSEFTHTALVLPDKPSPVLTKELLYTGITRSSEAFTLIYSEDKVLQTTLNSQVQRASGLL